MLIQCPKPYRGYDHLPNTEHRLANKTDHGISPDFNHTPGADLHIQSQLEEVVLVIGAGKRLLTSLITARLINVSETRASEGPVTVQSATTSVHVINVEIIHTPENIRAGNIRHFFSAKLTSDPEILNYEKGCHISILRQTLPILSLMYNIQLTSLRL